MEIDNQQQHDQTAKQTQSTQRFEIELEFIQCLANPKYLNYLAQEGYFEKKDFLNYLKYLEYWKRPEYARFIIYPLSLLVLDKLNGLNATPEETKEFRKLLARMDFCEYLHQQIFFDWKHKKDQQQNDS